MGKGKEKEKKVKEVKEEKKETPFWKRFLIVIGLFIFAFLCYNFASAMLILGKWFWGFFLFLVGFIFNIFIFIKGKKIAVILGVFLLIGAIVYIVGVGFFSFLFGGETLQELSQIEQNQILENKSENIENLFYGFENKNYDIFSENFDGKLKERYDKIAFLNLYDGLGKITSKNCSKAAKTSTGYDVVLCEVEAENKKTSWDMRFYENNTLWGLYLRDIYPNVTIDVKSKRIAETIGINKNGAKIQLNHAENYVFLILSVSIKSNEDEKTKIHSFQFINEKYTFGSISNEYKIVECNSISNTYIEANEEKQGCLIFQIYEDYEEGTIVAI